MILFQFILKEKQEAIQEPFSYMWSTDVVSIPRDLEVIILYSWKSLKVRRKTGQVYKVYKRKHHRQSFKRSH